MRIRSVFIAGLVLAAMSWAQTTSAPATSNTAAINQQNANNLCRFFFSDLKPSATVAQLNSGKQGSIRPWQTKTRSGGCPVSQ